MANDTQLDLWEVFTQRKSGTPFIHAGSLHAADNEQALQNARDVYARRDKPYALWVVPSSEITSSKPEDNPAFFDPGDKPYRHPKFYKIPKGVSVDID